MKVAYTDFNEYHRRAMATNLMPLMGHPVVYPMLGLMGETGEVAEKIKKIIRDKDGVFTKEDTMAIVRELGDVLWYLTAVAHALGYDLCTVAAENLNKVERRKMEGKTRGSGDNR